MFVSDRALTVNYRRFDYWTLTHHFVIFFYLTSSVVFSLRSKRFGVTWHPDMICYRWFLHHAIHAFLSPPIPGVPSSFSSTSSCNRHFLLRICPIKIPFVRRIITRIDLSSRKLLRHLYLISSLSILLCPLPANIVWDCSGIDNGLRNRKASSVTKTLAVVQL